MSRAPLSRLAAEGVDNAASGRLVSLAMVLVTAVAVGGVAIGEGAGVADALDREARFRRGGGYILEVTAADLESAGGTGVARSACEGLARSGLVAASGSVSSASDAAIGHLPGERLGVVDATAGFVAVLGEVDGRQDRLDAVILSPSRMDELGLVSGSLVRLGEAPPSELDARPIETLGQGYTRAAMVVVPPTGTGRACYIAVEPPGAELALEPGVLAAAFPGTTVTVRRVLSGADLVERASQTHAERAARFAWIAGASAIAACWGVMLWVKRSERALYRTIGLSRLDRGALASIEGLVLVLAGGLLGLLVHLGTAHLAGWPTAAFEIGWWSGAACLAGGSALVTLVGLAARTSDPLAALKDR